MDNQSNSSGVLAINLILQTIFFKSVVKSELGENPSVYGILAIGRTGNFVPAKQAKRNDVKKT